MKHFKITDNKEQIISDNLAENCINCFNECDSEGILVPTCHEYGNRRRFGKRVTNSSICFLCCDKTKTTKLFRDKLEALSYSYGDLIIPIKEIRKEEQKKVNRLVHNLTSINAHNIQEIYDLVPQDVLAKNWRNQLEYIKEEITNDPKKAALMFLRIAKHNVHMKSEFSIYRKIERDDSIELDIREHSIRSVILNVLHTFFSDFTKRNIYVEVLDFYHKIKIDYETIQVAFYHLIDNAAKYTIHSSKIIISANETDKMIEICFSMRSAYVSPEERLSIMKEGISGEQAKKMQRQGDGIGMWRIEQMIHLNKGKFEAKFGELAERKMGFSFSDNEFIVKFKKY